MWAWSHRASRREFALVGQTDGTAFVEVTIASNPVYLGRLPTHTVASAWRDLETYRDHAFIVADAAGDHGVQIFDLNQLLEVPDPPITFSETARYAGIGSSRTITIDPMTGFALANGRSDTCGGGPHMINIRDPVDPRFAGCNDLDGDTSDVQ